MNEFQNNNSLYSQDITVEEQTFKQNLFHFFYLLLSEKKEMKSFILNLLHILEIIQLISYAFTPPHLEVWNLSNADKISTVIGALRLSSIMQFVSLKVFAIIFYFIAIIIFCFFLLILMQILLGDFSSKIYSFLLSITNMLIEPFSLFLFIPLVEILLLSCKCKNNHIYNIKEEIKCWSGDHYLYTTLGIIISLIFFIFNFILSIFNFYPFQTDSSNIRLNSKGNSTSIIMKFIFILNFIFNDNDYTSNVILLIFAVYLTFIEINNKTFNNYTLEVIINLRNASITWTYFVLLIANLFKNSRFDCFYYLLIVGYPFIIYFSIILNKSNECNIDYNFANFTTVNEFLSKIRIFNKLLSSFLDKKKKSLNYDESTNQRYDLIMKGMIKIHNESCIDEECPLSSFTKNIGNYNVQKQCLLNYMNLFINSGMKRFPNNRLVLLYYIQFNYSKRLNLIGVKNNLEIIKKMKNSIVEEFVIYYLEQKMKNKNSESFDYTEMQQENEIIFQDFQRLKFLVINCTKLYMEFWGIFATNITNNLNTIKLYSYGEKINLYLKEMNDLWENNLKLKKMELENQCTAQLYSRFLLEILWNKKKSEEVQKKINEEHHQLIKKKSEEKENQSENIESILENQDFVIFATSNEKGKCKIIDFSNSVSNLTGYTKEELINKPIEFLMPSIFIDNHAKKVSNFIKKFNTHELDNNEEFFETEENKQSFILMKSKAGYLKPLKAKHSLFSNNDFSGSYVIKTKLEYNDPKSLYAYYILTKPDFSVEGISSSSLNLGLSMDLLKKDVVKINLLIRDNRNDLFNLAEDYIKYKEEPKQIVWIFPCMIYPKSDTLKNKNKDKTILELTELSPKKKFLLQIFTMKYDENEILGFVMKFTEIMKKKNTCPVYSRLIPRDNKNVMFDLLNLKYIRTILVKKKSGLRNLREKEDYEINALTDKKSLIENKNIRRTNQINEDLFESSDDEEGKKKIEITKDKLIELQSRNSNEIKKFISLIPFYGNDVSLEKHRPNKEKYIYGKTQEPLVKIEISNFTKRLEKKMRENPEMFKKINHMKKSDESIIRSGSNDLNKNAFDYSSSSSNVTMKNEIAKKNINDLNNLNNDASTSLTNIFNSKSITYLKIINFFMFLLVCVIIIIEFCFGYTFILDVKNRFNYLSKSYDLCNVLLLSKYFITEAVFTNSPLYNYSISIKIGKENYINYLKKEMASCRQEFENIFSKFSTASLTFSKEYINFISNTNITITSITSTGKVTNDPQPFVAAMNRISTLLFYVSTVTNEKIDMSDSNCYELIYNLLNGYFVATKSVTLILIENLQNKLLSFKNVLYIFIILSIVISILFILIFLRILAHFIADREKPINLFLAIKKKIFEDLKNSSEAFSNKLLNTFFGNEDIEEESQQDYQPNIQPNDINIIKFKAQNEKKPSLTKEKTNLYFLVQLIIYFLIFCLYIINKCLTQNSRFIKIYNFIPEYNLTQSSYTNAILSVDIIKSFFLNDSIPIITARGRGSYFVFKSRFFNIMSIFSDMLQTTTQSKELSTFGVKKNFFNYIYGNFSKLIKNEIDKEDYEKYIKKIEDGFKSVMIEVLEILKYITYQCLLDVAEIIKTGNKTKYVNFDKFYTLHELLLKIVRPFSVNLIELLNLSVSNSFDKLSVIHISIFIAMIVLLVLFYCILWKKYEHHLDSLLKKSVDLINLIPEEIKDIIITKLNE